MDGLRVDRIAIQRRPGPARRTARSDEHRGRARPDRRAAARQRVLRRRRVRPRVGTTDQGRASRPRRVADGQDHAAGDGGPDLGDRGGAVRHHGVLARSRRGRRARLRSRARAGLPPRRALRGLAAPGLVHPRDVGGRLPARRARRDGPEEPRPGRPGACRGGLRSADGRAGHVPQAGGVRPERARRRRCATAARRATQRRELDLHPRGGRGARRRVTCRGAARGERVRTALRRARTSPPARSPTCCCPRAPCRRSARTARTTEVEAICAETGFSRFPVVDEDGALVGLPAHQGRAASPIRTGAPR